MLGYFTATLYVYQEADLAAGPLTVTSVRERVVDFSKPLLFTSIVAIMKQKHATRWNIRTLDDLGRQSNIKYGVLESGATKSFFESSRNALYAKMWLEMDRDVNGLVRTNEAGINRVISSNDEHPWAFIGESSLLEYAAKGRCDLKVVAAHHPIGRGLSMATPIGSMHRDRLTLAILEMLEDGQIQNARIKWFDAPFTSNPVHCDAQRFVPTLCIILLYSNFFTLLSLTNFFLSL